MPEDEVPETLLSILKRIFSDCVPVMVDTIRATGEWNDQNPDTNELPRAIGEHTFQVGGSEADLAIFSQELKK